MILVIACARSITYCCRVKGLRLSGNGRITEAKNYQPKVILLKMEEYIKKGIVKNALVLSRQVNSSSPNYLKTETVQIHKTVRMRTYQHTNLVNVKAHVELLACTNFFKEISINNWLKTTMVWP